MNGTNGSATWVFVEPVDVWLLRDGRPFEIDGDNRARSTFPPPASVLAGALRTAVLSQSEVDLAAWQHGAPEAAALTAEIGAPGRPADGLRLSGPLPAHGLTGGAIDYLYPWPANLLAGSQPDGAPAFALALPEPDLTGRTNLPDGLQPVLPTRELGPAKDSGGRWLTGAGLRACLQRLAAADGRPWTPSAQEAVTADTLWLTEPRLGIALEGSTRRVREGHLYRAEFIRPQPGVGLAVRVEGLPSLAPQGWLALGGDRRAAWYQQVQAPGTLPAPPPEPLPQRFALLTLGPAWFDAGWRPADWSTVFEGPVRLVAAATERPLSVGGWDLHRQRPKPMRRYVAAGSVYWFETDGETRLGDAGFTQREPDWPQPGLGWCAVADSSGRQGEG